jgi:hypothetical protein
VVLTEMELTDPPLTVIAFVCVAIFFLYGMGHGGLAGQSVGIFRQAGQAVLCAA